MENKEIIKVDEITYQILTLALFNSHTMGFGNVEEDTGYRKEELKELDNKYLNSGELPFQRKDLVVIIAVLKWLIGVENLSDATDTLDITRSQGLKLIELLESGKDEINFQDWNLIE